jgi:hypothetical protein
VLSVDGPGALTLDATETQPSPTRAAALVYGAKEVLHVILLAPPAAVS